MRTRLRDALAVAFAGILLPTAALASHERSWDGDGDESAIQVDVWTDQGTGGVYRAGEPLSIYVRASRSCFVAIYDIDTQGRPRVLYPTAPLEEHFLRGGHTYRFPNVHGSQY